MVCFNMISELDKGYIGLTTHRDLGHKRPNFFPSMITVFGVWGTTRKGTIEPELKDEREDRG